MTPKQITYVRTLLRRAGITDEDQKSEIVSEYTEGRSTQLSDMTYRETQAIIQAFDQRENPRDKSINKILSLAHEMGWELMNGKVDMIRLDNWCLKYSPNKCALDDVPTNELGKLVTIFNRVYMDYLRG